MTRLACLASLFVLGAAAPKFESPIVTARTPGHAVEVKADLNGAKRLYLVVTDGGDSFATDWADWVEPKLVGPQGEKKLTDLKWVKAESGWGEPRIGANAAGEPLRVAGKAVNGIGTHANSVIEYELPAGYTSFVAKGGLDEGGTRQNDGGTTSVRFAVYTEKPPASLFNVSSGGGGGHEPQESLAGLDHPDDLEIRLFSSEPMLKNPTSIDVDARGRVWVCEVVNYRAFRNGDKAARPEGDRILILEDTDGDAKADKETVFYQGTDVDSAHGVTVLGEKVIVSAGANVFVFTDADGDDKPEKKEVLFTGISGVQHDHGIHAFEFGPDGRYYFNFGNAGERLKDKDGKPVVDLAGNVVEANGKPYRQGMVFRCEPDGSKVETLGWNFRNNWEVAVDSFGGLWQSDNDDDGNRGVRINYVMEYGNYGYVDEMTGAGWNTRRTNQEAETPQRHWHLNDPGVVPTLLLTGAGAPTGILVYEGDLLPARFRNQMIHADAGPNVVRAYPVEKDSAGYAATIEDIAVGNRDKWFRPSDVAIAPDGSLLIADWYDPGVGGHAMGDVERGRIFRVTPKGAGGKYVAPKFDLSTADGAAKALLNPAPAVRFLAWTALRHMGVKADAALHALRQNPEPRVQARAVWLLARLGDDGAGHVAEALRDPNSDLRITGLRAARQIGLDPIPVLAELVKDADPQVRRECAVALRHHDSPQAASLWAELAGRHDGKDRWYLEALGIAADGRWDVFLSAWLDNAGPDILKTPAGRDVVWRSRSNRTPALLAAILNDPSVPEAELPRYLRAFDFQSPDAARPVLLELAFAPVKAGDARRTLVSVETLSRLGGSDIAKNPEHRKALDAILDAARGTTTFVDLVGRFDLPGRDEELAALAAARPADEVGVAAIQSLLRRDKRRPIEGAVRGEDRDEAAGLIQALGNSADGRSVALLLPLVNDRDVDATRRRLAVQALAKTKPGAEQLVGVARSGKLDPSLKEATAAALHAVGDPGITSAANQLFPLPPGKGNATLPPIAVLAKRQGDVVAGRTVYLEAGTCAKCHQVNGIGQNVGPDLSEIGNKLSREAIYESILYPSAGISHNYESYSALTADGNVVTGLMVSQTPDEVTLKGADAIPRTFKRSEVEELVKQDVSLMPADLQKVLSEKDFVDLVEFLTTLKKAAK